MKSNQISDVRGAMRMGFDAAKGIVSVVERMHGTIQRRPAAIGEASSSAASGVAALVYRGVRRGLDRLEIGIDRPLAFLQSRLTDGVEGPAREAVVAALNGVYGDYLARTYNPLAIEMSLRRWGERVEVGDRQSLLRLSGEAPPSDKLLVLAHGLCMNDLKWNRDGHDHGASLAAELGCVPLYLRYNSGLAVAENGERFAALLETLSTHWPVPVREISIIGHSMGGLVARSACHFAEQRDCAWLKLLRRMVFLGVPHCGAPLERGGHWLDAVLDLSPYCAHYATGQGP